MKANLSRKAFIAILTMFGVNACSAQAGDGGTDKGGMQGPGVPGKFDYENSDERYVAQQLKRSALLSGHNEYVDLENQIELTMPDEKYDTVGLPLSADDSWVRSRYVIRRVTYGAGSSVYNDGTLFYETTDCTYDEDGLLVAKEKVEHANQLYGRITSEDSWEYNDSGLEETFHYVTYNDDEYPTHSFGTSTEYDEYGNITTEYRNRDDQDDDEDVTLIEYEREYDGDGRTLWHTKYEDGLDEGTCEYEYDDRGRLSYKSYYDDSFTEDDTYYYDNRDRIVEYIGHERGEETHHYTYLYLDDYHRIEVYDELHDDSHCSPYSIYQFNSQGMLVFRQYGGEDTMTVYSYDKSSNLISSEIYVADELARLNHYIYDDKTNLLKAVRTITSHDGFEEDAVTYTIYYSNLKSGEEKRYDEIDQYADLMLNLENAVGPDIWDAMQLCFGNCIYEEGAVVDRSRDDYQKALNYADELSKPKTLPSDESLLLRRSSPTENPEANIESWIGPWMTQGGDLPGITIMLFEDNTFELDSDSDANGLGGDAGTWSVFESGNQTGISLTGERDYAIMLEDGTTSFNFFELTSPITKL